MLEIAGLNGLFFSGKLNKLLGMVLGYIPELPHPLLEAIGKQLVIKYNN